jgi:hypothetical protein
MELITCATAAVAGTGGGTGGGGENNRPKCMHAADGIGGECEWMCGPVKLSAVMVAPSALLLLLDSSNSVSRRPDTGMSWITPTHSMHSLISLDTTLLETLLSLRREKEVEDEEVRSSVDGVPEERVERKGSRRVLG